MNLPWGTITISLSFKFLPEGSVLARLDLHGGVRPFCCASLNLGLHDLGETEVTKRNTSAF